MGGIEVNRCHTREMPMTGDNADDNRGSFPPENVDDENSERSKFLVIVYC